LIQNATLHYYLLNLSEHSGCKFDTPTTLRDLNYCQITVYAFIR
jgi:hypothetical protein